MKKNQTNRINKIWSRKWIKHFTDCIDQLSVYE